MKTNWSYGALLFVRVLHLFKKETWISLHNFLWGTTLRGIAAGTGATVPPISILSMSALRAGATYSVRDIASSLTCRQATLIFSTALSHQAEWFPLYVFLDKVVITSKSSFNLAMTIFKSIPFGCPRGHRSKIGLSKGAYSTRPCLSGAWVLLVFWYRSSSKSHAVFSGWLVV